MPVEDVSIPIAKKVSNVEVKPEKNPWKEQSEMIKSQVEYELAQKQLDNVRNPSSIAQEPAFQVKGSVNLGDFNPQEESRRQNEENRKREEKQLQMENTLREEILKERERSTSFQIEAMKDKTTTEIEKLRDEMSRSGGDRTITAQINDKIGQRILASLDDKKSEITEPNTEPSTASIKIKEIDSRTQLAIEEMRSERERKSREWEMEKLKWSQEIELRTQEMNATFVAAKEKNALIAGGIEKLGAIMAQATTDAATINSGISEQAGNTPKIIEAAIGESGESTCDCGATMAIAKDSKNAVCVKCGQMYSVKRS